MDKSAFLQKFNLNQLAGSLHSFRYHDKLKEAAVLVPLIEQQGELAVIFTRRASHLKHHGGQISFPGGKVEPNDKSLIDTALRESNEEIGLLGQDIDIIGQLKPYQTITGFNITPIIGLLNTEPHFAIDQNEVAEVFTVPLQHFIQGNSHTHVAMYHKGKKHKVHFFPYQKYNIWGATAAMLADLVAHLR
ncbi:CoA pyrophosphatase [Colwellia sp. MEBiC06753]